MDKVESLDSLEILYDGYFYDVTDFIKKHPGGDVINYYTEKGEDATHAIQQFHNRSINKIYLMLKGFKRRKATDELIKLDEKKLSRHRALTDDFAKLYVQIQNEGLFDPSYLRILWRLIECVLFLTLGFTLMTLPHLTIKLLGCVCVGLAGGRGAWVGHEAGHNSLTGSPFFDRFVESVHFGMYAGLSGRWWSRRHNKHHAMPQRLNHDMDLNTMPFLAHNAKVVKDHEEGQSFLIQNQAWLFLTIYCGLGYWNWRLILCPRSAWNHGNYLDLLMMFLNTILSYYLADSLWAILLAYWLGATYMFLNFSLNHTHLPVTEEPTHWVEYGLTHTANINSSPLVDWWMGYLNFQIEHHLFPTLPQFRCHLVQDRVKALAEKYDLPYHSFSYGKALALTLKNFEDVSREVRTIDVNNNNNEIICETKSEKSFWFFHE